MADETWDVRVLASSDVAVASPRGVVPIDPDASERGRRGLHEAMDLLAQRGIRAQALERHGSAADALLEEARKENVDLIVVGTRGLNALQRTVMGSVSTKVMHDAPCDVLVTR